MTTRPTAWSRRARGHRLSALTALAMSIAAACTPPSTGTAEPFLEGRVVAVQDGDSLLVEVDGERLRVRLAGIDAPERGQPWSRRSKEALKARVDDREVRINAVTIDVYGRTIGEVYADDVCVGCELVRGGHAWAYRRFDPDPVILELEDEARRAGRGLWGLSEAQRTPPWEWRRTHSSVHDKDPKPNREKRAPGCGEKRRCREMTDCAEARFYATKCGVDTLDGDGDGVPCEALCAEER